jgi:hypothetical protein
LLQLYTTLIAVELALKDHSTAWACGHDLQALATPLLGATASTLQSVLITLEQSCGGCVALPRTVLAGP